jgi:hypothetical protein
MIITSYDTKKKCKVTAGVLVNGIFKKRVTPKHLCKIFDCWGIGADSISELQELGCKEVRIYLGATVYRASFETWLDKAIKRDIGSGMQYFLKKEHMKGGEING